MCRVLMYCTVVTFIKHSYWFLPSHTFIRIMHTNDYRVRYALGILYYVRIRRCARFQLGFDQDLVPSQVSH